MTYYASKYDNPRVYQVAVKQSPSCSMYLPPTSPPYPSKRPPPPPPPPPPADPTLDMVQHTLHLPLAPH